MVKAKYNLDRYLYKLFADHGVSLIPDGGWLTTDHTYPMCRGIILDPQLSGSGVSVHVEIEVAINSQQTIVKVFSDQGETDIDALNNFAWRFQIGLFHVLLSAIWNIHDYDDQVERETWQIGLLPYEVYLGNIIRKATAGADVPLPQELIPTFEKTLLNTNLDGRIHWISFYYAQTPVKDNALNFTSPHEESSEPKFYTQYRDSGYDVLAEVLFDNANWSAGEILHRQVAWPRYEIFYSVRMFVLLLPKQEPTFNPILADVLINQSSCSTAVLPAPKTTIWQRILAQWKGQPASNTLLNQIHSNDADAGDPFGIRISPQKLSLFIPGLYGAQGFIRRLLIGDHVLKSIEVNMNYGDCQPAVVVSTDPLLVAAYSDELDCIALLKFRYELVNEYNLSEKSRLITVNRHWTDPPYDKDLLFGVNQTYRCFGFNPIIADFISDDDEKIKARKSEISEKQWTLTYELGKVYMTERPNIYRDGNPEFSYRSAIS